MQESLLRRNFWKSRQGPTKDYRRQEAKGWKIEGKPCLLKEVCGGMPQ